LKAIGVTEHARPADLGVQVAETVVVAGRGEGGEAVQGIGDVPRARCRVRGVEVDDTHGLAVAKDTVVGREVPVAHGLRGTPWWQHPHVVRTPLEVPARVVQAAQQGGRARQGLLRAYGL